MREACDLILKDLDGADARPSATRADEHRRTPMIGRTHGVHAEPMTFGLKLALWYAELAARPRARAARPRRRSRSARCRARSARSRTSPPSIEAERLPRGSASSRRRCRRRSSSATATPSCCRRSRSPAASLEKFALEIRGLQKTEIGEVEEPFAQGAEGLVGDAAQAQPDRLRADRRPGAAAARQRDGGAREHRALARARHLALVGRARDPARQLHRARSHAAALHAHRARHGRLSGADAREPRIARAAWCFPARCCSSSRRRGVSREQAYEWVQRNAMRSFHEQRDFKALLLADPDVTRVLTPAEIERAFDLDEQLQHVDAHLRPRVSATVPATAEAVEVTVCARACSSR